MSRCKTPVTGWSFGPGASYLAYRKRNWAARWAWAGITSITSNARGER